MPRSLASAGTPAASVDWVSAAAIEVGHSASLLHIVKSVGVLVQLIDLVAVASWRVTHVDSVASAPNVGFKQVIAPGAFVMLGLRGIPLSVGAGTSAVPNLRTVTLATGGAQQRYAFRPIDVRIAVDIPLFP